VKTAHVQKLAAHRQMWSHNDRERIFT